MRSQWRAGEGKRELVQAAGEGASRSLGARGDRLHAGWLRRPGLMSVLALALGLMPVLGAHDSWAQMESESDLPRARTVMNLGGEPLALTGPGTYLAVTDGALTGTILNRRFDARVSDDRVVGSGPNGPIDVTITPVEGGLRIDGQWNGQPVDLTFSERTITGKAMQRESTVGVGIDSCRYDIARSRRNVASGLVDCMRSDEPTRRVEVQSADQVAFNTTEAALLLVAFLTAPK
jgi:hypothetical protein